MATFIGSGIKKLDMYGIPIKLRIQKEEVSKTFLGGLLTIGTVLALFYITFIKSFMLVHKLNPSVTIEDSLYTKRPFFNLTKYTFPIAFGIQDCNQVFYPIPSRYFDFDVLMNKVYNVNGSNFETYYETENCTIANFPLLESANLSALGLERFKCVKDQNIEIGGAYDGDIVEYLVIRLKLCVGKPFCAPMEEIIDFFKKRDSPLSWNIYYQNSLINNQIYKKPVQYYIQNLWKNLRFGTYKMMDVYVKEERVETDKDPMFDFETESQSSIMYDYHNYDEEDMLTNNAIMDINIYASDHLRIHRRSYIKIQEIFYNVGGLAKTLKFFGYILTYFFSTFQKNQIILNRIFDFEDEDYERSEEKRERENYPSNSFNKAKNTRKSKINSDETEFFSDNSKISKDHLIEVKEYKEKGKKMELKFSSCEIINWMCCFSPCRSKTLKNKLALYEKSKTYLDVFLDIAVITHKLIEFEKFKKVIFTEEQFILFKHSSKSHCSLSENRDSILPHVVGDAGYSTPFSTQDEVVDQLIIKYLERVKENDNTLTPVDRKLVNLLSKSS